MKNSSKENLTPWEKSILVFSLFTSLYIFSFLFTAEASSTFDYPSLPLRPTVRQLYSSFLNVPVYKYDKSKLMIKNESRFDLSEDDFLGLKKKTSHKLQDLPINKNLINGVLVDSYEKQIAESSDVLLRNSLNSALELMLSLKYLDVDENKIVLANNTQDTVLINILNNSDDTSLVKISGYSLKPDRTSVSDVVEKLVLLINEKSKK